MISYAHNKLWLAFTFTKVIINIVNATPASDFPCDYPEFLNTGVNSWKLNHYHLLWYIWNEEEYWLKIRGVFPLNKISLSIFCIFALSSYILKTMGRHRREYSQGRLRLKYPKQNYDAYKYYTLYYEYTWLTEAPIRKSGWAEECPTTWRNVGWTWKEGNLKTQQIV